MTSREIVSRCIEFREPPRIGLHFQTDPIQGRVWDETDFVCVGYASDPQYAPQPGVTRWVTEWGDTRESLTTMLGEAVAFPLGDGWEQLESYRFPDFTAPWRYATLNDDVARGHAAGKYVYGFVPGLMLQTMDLRGMENWFLDHVEAPEKLAYVLDRISAIRDCLVERYAAAGADGVITWDDMGTNVQPFISPAMFREQYFAHYQRTIDRLHGHGMHFIHHCCGQVRPYMDLFVEAGCDVLQLDQPTLMDIDWLGDHYGGKLCFWNSTDIQTTLTSGSLEAIEAEAHRQIWKLGNYGGGFMVKAYQQPESIGVTVERAQRQYEAFKRHGHYPLKPPAG